jgi:hypothetical protein
MERNNPSNFANHGIQVNCKRLDVIVVVSLFLSSLSLWSSYCHSSCFLSLVMDTSQLQGRSDDATISAPFLGHVGMMMTTVITTMAMALERSITRLRQWEGLREVCERLSRHNQQSEMIFYTHTQIVLRILFQTCFDDELFYIHKYKISLSL